MDGLWATKSEAVRLIVPAIIFKISNICGPDPLTSQTDGQTDDMQSQYHCSASRGKNEPSPRRLLISLLVTYSLSCVIWSEFIFYNTSDHTDVRIL